MRPVSLRCRRFDLSPESRFYSGPAISYKKAPLTSSRRARMDSSKSDYRDWSNEDLIRRVSELEAKLRAQNIDHASTPSSSASLNVPKKRPKRPAKPFDPSKYSTRYIALKCAYLGKNYNGVEHHTNNTTPLPTVEEELWKALRKAHLIFPNFRDGQSEHEVCWDGCEYSKCGRTDKGVSAFGQVIALRVRSSQPKQKLASDGTPNRFDTDVERIGGFEEKASDVSESERIVEANWDHIKDELSYIPILNRVLPPDIRILAWCPNPPPDFSARFSCKERRYRYFFTNPAYAPTPGERAGVRNRGAWLDIDAMHSAAKKLEGLHDFRNFCKIDGSKQISNFERRVFQADIKPVTDDQTPFAFLHRVPFAADAAKSREQNDVDPPVPRLYYFEVHGSAFLWHQVRHMIAVIFLVGQGYEDPSIVNELLNVQEMPSKPHYEMASDTPLVLWDCIFPDPESICNHDHANSHISGYIDALDWIYAGDLADASGACPRKSNGTADRKYGSLSIMEDVWSAWKKAKMDEMLAGSLMDVFARQGNHADASRVPERVKGGDEGARVFDGSESPRSVGTYVPIMKRRRLEPPDVINARFAARKGWTGVDAEAADMDE